MHLLAKIVLYLSKCTEKQRLKLSSVNFDELMRQLNHVQGETVRQSKVTPFSVTECQNRNSSCWGAFSWLQAETRMSGYLLASMPK